MTENTTRRNFILGGMATVGSIAGNYVFQHTSNNASNSSVSDNYISKISSTMPERILGNTGLSLPIFGLGGAGKTPLSSSRMEKESIAIIEAALRQGVRYFDTAASYGPSESYLGKVLPQYRDDVFLASKTGGRDRDGAWRDLERSLKRLNTDYLDLWQFHHVSFDEELDQIFSSQGAIVAMEEAKEQKLIKYCGITGHHEPAVIANGLNRYPFDTTLVSINAADIHHPRPFIPTVLPLAKRRNIGVIAMKVPAYGRLFKPGVLDGMDQAMGYVLSLSGVHCCIIAAETVEQLEFNVRVAKAFQPLNSQEMAFIEKLTANAWQDNTFFRRWT